MFILALGSFLQLGALTIHQNLNVHLGVVFRPCRLAGNARILQRNLTCYRLQIVYLFKYEIIIAACLVCDELDTLYSACSHYFITV